MEKHWRYKTRFNWRLGQENYTAVPSRKLRMAINWLAKAQEDAPAAQTEMDRYKMIKKGATEKYNNGHTHSEILSVQWKRQSPLKVHQPCRLGLDSKSNVRKGRA